MLRDVTARARDQDAELGVGRERGPDLLTIDPVDVAVSLGSVFFGANTYIGNGPNFMVKSIAESSGVKCPSFFGYVLWSCAVLLPVLGLLTFLSVGAP